MRTQTPTTTVATLSGQSVTERNNTLWLGLAAATVVGILFALSNEDGPVLCPFRRCTGGYCPGCGLTRSGGRLLRGDVVGSYQQHPYLVFGVAQAAAFLALWNLGSTALKQRLRRWYRPLMFTNVGALFAIWIVRLASGSIPLPFS